MIKRAKETPSDNRQTEKEGEGLERWGGEMSRKRETERERKRERERERKRERALSWYCQSNPIIEKDN